MNTVLVVEGNRPVPDALLNYIHNASWQARIYDAETKLTTALEGLGALLLFSPCQVKRGYEYGEGLWYTYLRQNQPQLPLAVAGYQQATHSNYLDLLRLEFYPTNWFDQLRPVMAMTDTDYQDTLSPKLYRFFAGHGSESIVAVLIRIRLVVQMAQRELLKMQTPYSEIYRDLIAPAQLGQKWTEWRNRWVNYYPLFVATPFFEKLKTVGERASQLDHWMLAGGAEEEPLANGEILTILNALRDTLQEIENQYVLQKLSHSHR
ncbi:MAG: hypothetical protein D6772_12890 [Bacteroidetes bacterium]|nr:MAG: hypothetical protein D6772_12890 [Bacteroidota bacterium]